MPRITEKMSENILRSVFRRNKEFFSPKNEKNYLSFVESALNTLDNKEYSSNEEALIKALSKNINNLLQRLKNKNIRSENAYSIGESMLDQIKTVIDFTVKEQELIENRKENTGLKKFQELISKPFRVPPKGWNPSQNPRTEIKTDISFNGTTRQKHSGKENAENNQEKRQVNVADKTDLAVKSHASSTVLQNKQQSTQQQKLFERRAQAQKDAIKQIEKMQHFR